MKWKPRLWIVLVFFTCCYYHTSEASASEITCEEGSCNLTESKKDCEGIPFNFNTAEEKCFGDDISRFLENCPDSIQTNAFWRCDGYGTDSLATTAPQDYINISFYPVNFRYYNLSVKLDVPAGGYKLGFLGSRWWEPCYLCINSSFYTEEINITLEYSNYDASLSLTVDTFPIPLYPQAYKKEIKLPRYCADCERGIPYDAATCGFPSYKEPNVSIQCNGNHTSISWDKPYYQDPCSHTNHHADVNGYYLTITTCDGQSNYYFVNNTREVTIHTSDIFDFTLYAYSQCSGLYEYKLNKYLNVECSLPAESKNCQNPNLTCCDIFPGCPTPTLLPKPTATPSPRSNYLTVYVTASVGAVAILISIFIMVVLFFRCKQRRPQCPYVPLPMHECHSESSVLVIYSPDTPEQEKHTIMQNLGPDLSAEGVSSSFPDTRQPKQTLIHWITEQHERADAVFCVCNKEFSRDWHDSAAMQYGSDNSVAVQTLKELYERDLAKEGAFRLSKYAVVLTKPNDNTLIPSIMGTRKVIYISDTRALAEFALMKRQPV